MVFLLILQMLLVIFNAFIAGQLKATIDMDKIDGRDSGWKPYVLMALNLIASAFNVISIYGQGLNHS